MNISLTPELERRISAKVESGLYSTASEVVREALRQLFAADEERVQLVAKLNAELQEGLDALDRGEGISPEESDRRVAAIIDAHRNRAR